jgi:hypothetical protein
MRLVRDGRQQISNCLRMILDDASNLVKIWFCCRRIGTFKTVSHGRPAQNQRLHLGQICDLSVLIHNPLSLAHNAVSSPGQPDHHVYG